MSHFFPTVLMKLNSENKSENERCHKNIYNNENRSELNKVGEFANGVFSNAAMVVIMQPAFTLKTFLMNGIGLPPLGKLYSGTLVNILSGGPSEGLVFATPLS